MRIPAALLALALVGCATRPSTPTPADVRTLELSSGETEFPVAMLWTGAIIELPGGKVLIGGPNDSLHLLDFARGTRTLAYHGDSTQRILGGLTLLTGVADSGYVLDRGSRQLLVFAPNGALAATRTLSPIGPNATGSLDAEMPRYVGGGALYGESAGVGMPSFAEMMGGSGPKLADTVAIERYDPRSGTDTVAEIRNPGRDMPKTSLTNGVLTMLMTVPNAAAADEWVLMPDGRVAILRDGNYRVEFVGKTKIRTIGPPIPHVDIPLTEADKQRLRDDVQRMRDDMPSDVGRTKGVPGLPDVKLDVKVVEPTSWPANKAPYRELMASPDTLLWVMIPAGDTTKSFLYDVLDRDGRLVARLRTRPCESIVGFGRGSIYTFRSDTGELEHLRRYRTPIRR